VFKKDISEFNGQFDFIILQHSFEHMPESLAALTGAFRLLKHKKYTLVRIPVVPNFSWKKYGVNWLAMDPPRHLFLHSIASMKILSNAAGFQIADIVFDSNESQFWGSEQYCKDIPLMDKKSYLIDPKASIFSTHEIEAFKSRTEELNKNKEGDQASFYLYKP
jgi:SAM-dependent methyltransferase